MLRTIASGNSVQASRIVSGYRGTACARSSRTIRDPFGSGPIAWFPRSFSVSGFRVSCYVLGQHGYREMSREKPRPAWEPASPRASAGRGVGQLSLVEHALCPLDSRTSLQGKPTPRVGIPLYRCRWTQPVGQGGRALPGGTLARRRILPVGPVGFDLCSTRATDRIPSHTAFLLAQAGADLPGFKGRQELPVVSRCPSSAVGRPLSE